MDDSLTTSRPHTVRKPFAWRRIFTHVLLLIGSFVMSYPLVFGLLSSVSTQEVYLRGGWMPIPAPITFENYGFFVAQADRAPLWIVNTITRIVWYIVIPCTIAILCGYVFAKLRFRGRRVAFTLLLSSMMVPGIVYSLPLYVMMARWPLAGGNNLLGQGGHGFVNEWPSMLITGLVNVYYIFLMRQTFQTIPRDFEEAARVDGANTPQVLWYVYLPMLVPAIAVMVIFQSVGIWNDYVWPLIAVGGNPDAWPMALGFQRLMTQLPSGELASGVGTGAPNYPYAFTVAAIATIPTIILFLFFQRYFVEGVQGFAIKG